MNSQKQKILRVHPEFLLNICKDGLHGDVEVTNPIPSDASLIRIFQSGVYGELMMVIHSESFPELYDGEEIPEIETPLFIRSVK